MINFGQAEREQAILWEAWVNLCKRPPAQVWLHGESADHHWGEAGWVNCHSQWTYNKLHGFSLFLLLYYGGKIAELNKVSQFIKLCLSIFYSSIKILRGIVSTLVNCVPINDTVIFILHNYIVGIDLFSIWFYFLLFQLKTKY